MKVAKEEIIGLITALGIFVQEDEEAETRRYREMTGSVVDAFVEVPGLRARVEHDDHSYLVPTAVITFTRDWSGPGRDGVVEGMARGESPIFLHTLGDPDEVGVDPINLDDREIETVVRRLREEFLGTVAHD